MSALLANVSMFSLLFWHSWKGAPLLGGQWWLGYFPVDPETNQLVTRPTAGLAWYLSSISGVQEWLLPMIWPHKYGTFDYVGGFSPEHPHAIWQVGVRVLVYTGVMIIGCIFFAKFWIETTNMGAGAVARQIQRSGMHIPGFRRDPRILERVLQRYIPAVTVLSGAGVGALAAGADLIGTTGNVSGTGVLLAVSVMINFFEAIGREQMIEMHPVLRRFFAE
jgi:preprotein translocase subunit SecY